MKKLALFLVLALGSMFVVAQNGRIDLRSTSSAEITHSDFNSLRATFNYGSIESIEIATERGAFSEIAIEGTYASGEIGTPELPASHQLLAVPFGATPRVSVMNFTTTDYNLSDYGINTLVPHQPSVRKDQNPEEVEFVYNAAAYQTRSLASMPEATIEVQGMMRGIRVGSLVINPVSYNPASNTLRVFNNIEVEVSFDGADYAETERMLLSTYSPYFDIVYKQMFNYRNILDVYTDHPDLMAYPVHMIVITPEDYISALQPWIDWKIQKGFDVNVVTTAQAGSNYNAIRTYVQNLYNTGVNQGATPTFLVLVGDVAQVPNTTGSATQKVTDLYYGTVDNDYFPDMFYSRMSAENTNQLTAIVNKILQYEQYTMPDPSYLDNVTLIAGWDSQWTPRVGAPTINYATTYYYNTAHGFTEVHSHVNQSQYPGCYNALSTGVGFVNYTAHGNNQEWSNPILTNSGVNQLTNANKYFLAMGNCCLSGNFGYFQPCFGEAMIRGENKAAYSYIGSCPNTYWYEDYYFGVGATTVMNQTPSLTNTATGVYDGIWMDDTYNTVSSIVFLGNIAVCYSHMGGYQTSANPTYYWQAYHVLGDGSIMPYRVNPTPNTVSHASTYPAGTTLFQVSAEEGSYVAISQNNVLKGVALVPESGTANVQVAPDVLSGEVHIVVTKPQRQPYIQDIPVGGAPQLYTINVSANPADGGTVEGGGPYNQGANCTVTAVANPGFVFDKWTENGMTVSSNANYTFTVNGDRNLVAQFQQNVPCEAPSNVQATYNPDDISHEVNVSWESVPTVNTYKVFRDGMQIAWGYPYTNYHDMDVPYGEHCYTIVSECTFGDSDPSEAACVVVEIPCNAPESFRAEYVYEDDENYGVELHWSLSNLFFIPVCHLYRLDENDEYQLIADIHPDGFVVSYFDEVDMGTYSYMLTAEYQIDGRVCTSEPVYASCEVTSVYESALQFEIYPNPVNDKMTIEAQASIDKLEIYNLMGVLVYSQSDCSNKTEVTIDNLPSGIYFLRLTMGDGTQVLRFVKE